MTRGRPINSAEGRGAAVAGSAAMPPLASVCGSFPIRISRDGTWFYHGSPIGRKPLARLFSTVLARREDGSYWLSTPYESGRIEVDDRNSKVRAVMVCAGTQSGCTFMFGWPLDCAVRATPTTPRISFEECV